MSGRLETSSTGKRIKISRRFVTSSDFSCVLVFSRRGIYGLDEEEIVELGRQMIDIHFATRWSDNHLHLIMKCLLNEEQMVSQVPRCHLWSIRKGQVPRPSLNLPSQGCHKAEHQGKHCQFNVKRKQNKQTKITFPQAKAVNRKADNATGMEQPVSINIRTMTIDDRNLHFHFSSEQWRSTIKIFTFTFHQNNDDRRWKFSLFLQETKHDVSLSHEGGDLSLGLLRKENKALPCDKVL